MHWHNRTLDAWATAAAKVAPSVVILGMSVTAGCNTGRMFTADGQFVPLPGRQGVRGGKRLGALIGFDHLRWQLSGAHDAVVDASVRYKNAVPPDFLPSARSVHRRRAGASCCSRFAPPREEKQLVRLIKPFGA